MGNIASIPEEHQQENKKKFDYVDILRKGKDNDPFFQTTLLSKKTLIYFDDPELKKISENLTSIKPNSKESRSLSCFICSAIGDALGCHSEFSPFSLKSPPHNFQSFKDLPQTFGRAQPGQWTDDTSMALCLADSLLELEGEFKGDDIRLRFLLWWHLGYNNGRKGQESFGLGGNIAESFLDFHASDYKSEFMQRTEENKENNGNGSLMRLAPVPIYFHDDEQKGLEYAKKQSYTTHTGDEAAECCRLLTHLIVRLVNRGENEDHIPIFQNLATSFSCEIDCPGVMALARSEIEGDYPKNTYNKVANDRNWNWKSQNYVFSPTRHAQNPGYFGSYCMDALVLSLHLAYHSKNAKEAILNAVNAGGDSDTVAAITGQIVGAIYGLQPEIMELYNEKPGLSDWDEKIMVTAAYKLFHHFNKKDKLF